MGDLGRLGSRRVLAHVCLPLPPRRNLPYKITAEELYEIFGRYGALRQVRLGNAPDTKGTAFVVYEDIYDAKAACDHLSGFNVGGRYLVVLYYHQSRAAKAASLQQQQAELEALRARVAAGEAAAAAAAAGAAGDDADSAALDDDEERRGMGRR
jgi:pre-mRNA branch site protein p14